MFTLFGGFFVLICVFSLLLPTQRLHFPSPVHLCWIQSRRLERELQGRQWQAAEMSPGFAVAQAVSMCLAHTCD